MDFLRPWCRFRSRPLSAGVDGCAWRARARHSALRSPPRRRHAGHAARGRHVGGEPLFHRHQRRRHPGRMLFGADEQAWSKGIFEAAMVIGMTFAPWCAVTFTLRRMARCG